MALTRIPPVLFAGLLLALACGNGTTSSPDTAMAAGLTGLEIYNANCKMCHGKDGSLGMGDAKDLSISALSTEEMIAVVSMGKGTMVAYKDILSKKQIEAVVTHVHTLHKSE